MKDHLCHKTSFSGHKDSYPLHSIPLHQRLLLLSNYLCNVPKGGLLKEVLFSKDGAFHRWSLTTGGPSLQVVPHYRWSLTTGGPSPQVIPHYRWSLSTGGPSLQVVPLYRWSLSTGGPSLQVVPLYRWSLSTGGPSLQVVPHYR